MNGMPKENQGNKEAFERGLKRGKAEAVASLKPLMDALSDRLEGKIDSLKSNVKEEIRDFMDTISHQIGIDEEDKKEGGEL